MESSLVDVKYPTAQDHTASNRHNSYSIPDTVVPKSVLLINSNISFLLHPHQDLKLVRHNREVLIQWRYLTHFLLLFKKYP